jgi:hypothetical protein
MAAFFMLDTFFSGFGNAKLMLFNAIEQINSSFIA